jgi:hypothetical protein
MGPDVARKTLAGIRLFNGTVALVAPQLLLRRLGADTSVDPSGKYPFRMFGIRTIVIGADLLTLTGDNRRRATRVAVLIHATDTISAAAAGLRGDVPRKPAILATLLSATNTALALVATQE